MVMFIYHINEGWSVFMLVERNLIQIAARRRSYGLERRDCLRTDKPNDPFRAITDLNDAFKDSVVFLHVLFKTVEKCK